jgi:hypothetical protein
MSNISELKDTVLNSVNKFFSNEYVGTGIIIILTLYATLLGPNLPNFLNNLFKYNLFKIVFFFLFLLIVQRAAEIRPSIAIIMSIAFVLTVDYLYLNSKREDFKNSKHN